jgi:hypothetical protein
MAVGPLIPVTCLAAQEPAIPDNTVVLANGEVNGSTGRIAVNIAAGNHNQQVSSALVAQGSVALTHGDIVQHAAITASEDTANRVEIGSGAFVGISGLASINITAGTQNQSANLATLAIGQSGALSDQLLEQTRAPIEPSGGTALAETGPNDVITIDDGAFGRGNGVFQANLIGGERNSSANTFSLTVTASGQP